MSEPATQTVEVCPRQTGKTSRLLRYLEGRPERWRVDVAAPVKRWAPHALFNSREAAEAYAEPLVKRSAQRSLMARVVDRDHEGGRVSGPCAGGNHHYCLGPHAILPCTCNCHEHTDPEQR